MKHHLPTGGEKTMKRIVSWAALAAVIGVAVVSVAGAAPPRDADAVRMFENAPSADEYPDASAAILLERNIVTLQDDGSVTNDLQLIVKVFKLRGRQRYANLKQLYDSEHERLKIIRARTLKRVRDKLRKLDVAKDEVNDITPPWLVEASLYSNVLQRVISFPAVGRETVIELKTTKSTLPQDDPFSGVFPLRKFDDPVLVRELCIVIPKGRELRYKAERIGSDPEIVTRGGKTYYTWRIERLKQIKREPFMPPIEELSPRVFVTASQSWEEVSTSFSSVFFPKAECEGELKDRVNELISTASSKEEKLRKVYFMVTREIGNINLPLGLGGYEPHSASEVYHNRYGDCRDKAVLLVAALRQAGFKAYPALVKKTPSSFVKNIPTLKQFDHILVAVEEAPHEYRFFDPFARDCIYGYFRNGAGNVSLVVRENGVDLERIPTFPADRNSSVKEMTISIHADASAEGTASAHLDGLFDLQAREKLRYATRKERDMIFSQAVNRISEGAVEISHTTSDLEDQSSPVALTVKFRAEDFCVTQGKMLIVHLPEFPFRFASAPAFAALKKRAHPLQTGSFLKDTYVVKLQTPDGYRLMYSPPGTAAANEYGRWELSCRVTDRGEILFERSFSIEKTVISADEYPEFKKAFDEISGPKNQLLLFEKTEGNLE